MTLRSDIFDDIYFSPEDGVAETRHVFLEGNNLPQAWDERDQFTIVETGFGTGLNFLCAWKLFEQTAQAGQVLDYVSFEKYPLSQAQIKDVLSVWGGEFEGRLEQLIDQYPIRVPGFHRIILNERVRLTLIFDDLNEAIDQLHVPRGVNCWFLDGFAPSKNPDMWSEKLFTHMTVLSASQASFATFTAAGFVRRGLEGAGFAVEKVPGFGRKREMLTGRFVSGEAMAVGRKNKTVAIIGGGLAGTACAYVLQQQGLSPVIYEASDYLASGASGNPTGLYNPRFFAYRTNESDFYVAAFAQAVRTLKGLGDISFEQCGALHLLTDDKRIKKLSSAFEQWGWHSEHLALLGTQDASGVAGVDVPYDALYLPDAGYVSPAKLCHRYAEGVDVRLNTPVKAIEELDADIVILACGAAVKQFTGLENVPVETVRGQVSFVQPSPVSNGLKTNVCYGGYMSPVVDGQHVVGSTFQKWLSHCDVIEEDHDLNMDNLAKVLPDCRYGLIVYGGRASLRTASKDRFPLIGRAPDCDNVYMSTAHGSHGILSSLMGAHIIADDILTKPYCLSQKTLGVVAPDRFIKRAQKKQGCA